MVITEKNIEYSKAPRRVSILGATGSVGRNTLDLISRQHNAYKVVALTAQHNVELLAAQARQFNAELAVIGDAAHHAALQEALAGTGVAGFAGDGGRALEAELNQPAAVAVGANGVVSFHQ